MVIINLWGKDTYIVGARHKVRYILACLLLVCQIFENVALEVTTLDGVHLHFVFYFIAATSSKNNQVPKTGHRI